MSTTNWNLDPPPGFLGLQEHVRIQFYYRNLPDWRQVGATYFVTFRLADSLPQSKLRALRSLREEWQRRHGIPTRHVETDDWQSVLRNLGVSRQTWDAFSRELMQKTEDWLDQGMGSCWLRRSHLSKIVADALEHFDGERYELGAYVVMPNHVHAIVRPLDALKEPLERILQSRKRYTAYEINKLLRQKGKFWQAESFDRIIRDEEHLYQCLQYIGRNPVKARLAEGECRLWVNPVWVELGWRLES